MKIYSKRLKFLITFAFSFLILSIPINQERLFDTIHNLLPQMISSTREYASQAADKIKKVQENREQEMVQDQFVKIPKEEYKSIKKLKEKLKQKINEVAKKERPLKLPVTKKETVSKKAPSSEVFDSYDFRE